MQVQLLEWRLIYGSAEQLEKLIPRIDELSQKICADSTGTNVMSEVGRQ
jgi:hypothetical protein